MSGGKEDEEEHIPDTLEEAGALEADVGARLIPDQYYGRSKSIQSYAATTHSKSDQQLAGIDPRLSIAMDPFAHRELRPEMMFIRDELRQAKLQTLAVRRTALRKLLLQDFMQEDCELRNIGLAYAPTDP